MERLISRRLLIILLAGILIRLLLMPFLTHDDLLVIYCKAFGLVFQKRLYPGPLFGTFWISLHGLFIKLFSWFFPKISGVLITDYAMNPIYDLTYNSPWILRTLFLLKVPFLIFDVLSGLLILRFFQNEKEKLLAFGFWMFNPITIFTFYIHGRGSYAFLLFLIILSFYFWKKEKIFASFLSLGLAASFRPYLLFFLPVFVLCLKKKLTEKIKYLVIGILPLFGDIILTKLLADKSFTPPMGLPSPSAVLMTANLDLGSPTHQASLLVAVLLFFYLWLGFKNKLKRDWQTLVNLSCLSYIPLISLGYFNTQTYSWLALFFIFLVNKGSKYLYLYFLIIISWLMMVLDYGQHFTFGLLSPLNTFVFSHHSVSFNTLLLLLFPQYNLTHLGRSLSLGTLLFLAYSLLKDE